MNTARVVPVAVASMAAGAGSGRWRCARSSGRADVCRESAESLHGCLRHHTRYDEHTAWVSPNPSRRLRSYDPGIVYNKHHHSRRVASRLVLRLVATLSCAVAGCLTAITHGFVSRIAAIPSWAMETGMLTDLLGWRSTAWTSLSYVLCGAVRLCFPVMMWCSVECTSAR